MNDYGGHRYTISEDKDPDISWEDYKHPEYSGNGLAVFFVVNKVAKVDLLKNVKRVRKECLCQNFDLIFVMKEQILIEGKNLII